MVEKGKEEVKTGTKTKKKTKQKNKEIVEEFSISELLEMNQIKPLYAVGFLDYYGLTEDFKKEFETEEVMTKFSEKEFSDMYENYMKREI